MAAKKKTAPKTVRTGKRSVEVHYGPIEKWGEGVSVEGVYQRRRPLGAGFVVDLMVDGELQTWGCPKHLSSLLEAGEVKSGDEIEIVCNGKRESERGRTYWYFELYVSE